MKKNGCKMNHGWAYLNKRFDNKELTIVAFCDECPYIDKKALKLQKAEDKAKKAYDDYKHETLKELYFPSLFPSKSKDN